MKEIQEIALSVFKKKIDFTEKVRDLVHSLNSLVKNVRTYKSMKERHPKIAKYLKDDCEEKEPSPTDTVIDIVDKYGFKDKS